MFAHVIREYGKQPVRSKIWNINFNSKVLFQYFFRIWRHNIGNEALYVNSWRDMYLLRPRLNFDGCYICKSSYIRAGEQSLDSFYSMLPSSEFYSMY